MTRPPDMLRFKGGVADGDTRGWNGPWPPPAEMIAVAGAETGITRFTERHLIDPDVWQEIGDCDSIHYTVYRLRNASILPDDFDSDVVFRGADYQAAGT